MKPAAESDARPVRQFRASVTTRRKLASLRVSSQRRRLRRIGQLYTLYTKDPEVLDESPAESRMRGTNSR